MKLPMFATHEMTYIWYLPKKKYLFVLFYTLRRFTVKIVTVFRKKLYKSRQRIVCDRIPDSYYSYCLKKKKLIQRNNVRQVTS